MQLMMTPGVFMSVLALFSQLWRLIPCPFGLLPYIPLRGCTELYDFGHQNRCCPAILAIPKRYLAKKWS